MLLLFFNSRPKILLICAVVLLAATVAYVVFFVGLSMLMIALLGEEFVAEIQLLINEWNEADEKRSMAQTRFRIFGNVGRMALTNYIFQSLICATFCLNKNFLWLSNFNFKTYFNINCLNGDII
ncbi:DUF418 domain-containing protein [Peptococcaceae bacterium]|nr:DUF418 domain-containing protein [Peptococcaceae bacterium]